MKYAALALLLAAATPACAQDFPYSPLAVELQSGAFEGAPNLSPPPDYFHSIKLAGGLELRLDRFTMEGMSEVFGTSQQTYQYVGYTTSWLCFTDAGRRVWYIADQTYETREDVYVSQIIAEPADPATDAMFLCKPEPKAMLGKQAALPMIGATRAELNAFYKADLPPGTAYAFSSASNSDDMTASDHETKTVYYRLKDDVVDAMSIAAAAETD